jgi:hypothetical protein
MLSNSNVPTNATCCNGGEEGLVPRAHVDVVAITVFSLVAFALCALVVVFVRLREKMVSQAQLEEDVASRDRKEEKTRTRKKSISSGLIIRKWVPDEKPTVVESTKGDRDTSPSGESAAKASQPSAPPINSSSTASCAIGSDDCESLDGEEEMAGCAICLSHFRPQQLVCESNNPSCRHIFHKDCIVDWLIKGHDECPMCREVYLIETV